MPTAPPETAPLRPSRSLSRTLVGATLAAATVGMLVSAAVEYLSGEPATLTEFTRHHLFPTLLIVAAVAVTLTLLLHSKVIAPVKQIFVHLYRIGSGQFTPLNVDSGVSEIRTVVDGVNLLVTRLKDTPDDQALGNAVKSLAKLRTDMESATTASGASADPFVPVMRDLRRLESDLLSAITAAKQSA